MAKIDYLKFAFSQVLSCPGKGFKTMKIQNKVSVFTGNNGENLYFISVK